MALRFQAPIRGDFGVPLTKTGVFGIQSWLGAGGNGASLILEMAMEITKKLALFIHLLIHASEHLLCGLCYVLGIRVQRNNSTWLPTTIVSRTT